MAVATETFVLDELATNPQTRKLLASIAPEKLPKHVGVILDGNRRYARRLLANPFGHEEGGKAVKRIIECCLELKIPELTVYAFSIQNFNRPREEYDYLMNLFRKMCDKAITQQYLEHPDVRVCFCGRLHLLPEDLQEKMREVERITKDAAGLLLNICLAYGGREEIVDAVRALAEDVVAGLVKPTDITDDTIKQRLLIKQDPDLIIRTGGEQRISNFLLWQGSYAELFFTKTLLPAFTKEEFVAILVDYTNRKRRFGK